MQVIRDNHLCQLQRGLGEQERDCWFNVAQAGLELLVQSRDDLELLFLSLLRAGITGVHRHTWLKRASKC